MKEVFISWSGDKANKYADFLEKILNEVFDKREKTFYSRNIESGKVWLESINKALSESKIGIILLTKESICRPWVNFEAGAIFKADYDNSTILPIYIDITKKDLDNHPLRFFQSNYVFTWDSLIKLMEFLNKKLNWNYSFFDLSVIENIKGKVLKFIEVNNESRNIVEVALQNENISVYETGCFLAEMKGDKFWEIRKKIIEDAEGELIMVGQSLEDAFGEEPILSIVEALKSSIVENKIKKIKILLSDPVLFSGIRSLESQPRSPLARVSLTMETLLCDIFPVCETYGCKIKIYFIPLLEIDHAVITGNYMAFRSTKLWTRNGNYKGSFCVYNNINENNSEYNAHKEYLYKLMDNSTKINLDIDIYDAPDDGETMRRHKSWRRAVKDVGYTMVELYKLYHAQLVNYVADDWRNEPRIEQAFRPSKDIKCYEDLFNYHNLLGDDTQKILLPYIRQTKELFEKVIDKYDSSRIKIGNRELPRSGVMIYPSLDLGFPNNIQRLAGGFATGMLIMWKCGTPIIPVDATVNVCSSSVFKLDTFDFNMSDNEFIIFVREKLTLATDGMGYSFSFDSGNHFLMIAQDIESRDIYLILHSSANEFKDSYMGLYPVENNWYSNYIRTYPSPNAPERYIRYIKDDDARYFIENAHRLEKYNIQIHNWFANAINNPNINNISSIPSNTSGKTYHHYYMPTDNSIAIGTYVEQPGTIVPIFSNVEKDIYMFEISKDNWKIRLGGKEVCLVPHGWGQVIENVTGLKVDNENKILRINDDEYKIHSKVRIKNDKEKHVRNFENGEEFFGIGDKMIKGKPIQTLRPMFLYCSKKKGRVHEVLE